MFKRSRFFQNIDFSVEKIKEKRKIKKYKNSKKVVEFDEKEDKIFLNSTQQPDGSIIDQPDTSNQNQPNTSNQNQPKTSAQHRVAAGLGFGQKKMSDPTLGLDSYSCIRF